MAIHIAQDLQVDGDVVVEGQIQSIKPSGAPISVISTEVNPNLNADMVDGIHANRMLFGDNARASLGGVDIDTVTKSGIHYASVGNRPDSQNGYALVMMHNSNDAYFGELFLPNSPSRQPAWRCKDNGTLSGWDKFITESNLGTRVSALGYITQTLGDARYAPISHTHDMSTIAGLVTALNGKLSNNATVTINGETKSLNTNPSFTVTAGISEATADGRYGRLGSNNTWIGQQTFTRGSASGAATVMNFQGTDHASGVTHRLFIRKDASAVNYTIGMTNEVNKNGSVLNLDVDILNYAGLRVATQSWVASQGYITSLAGYVPTSRTITVGTGMTGGGNLGGNISIGLSFGTNSDNVAAGNHTHSQYALTSHTHEIGQIVNLQTQLNGKVGTGTTITINGVTQDLSQNRSWTVSGGGGGNISGAGTGTNNPIAIWAGTYNIAYSSLYYYTAGTPSRSVLGIGGVLIGSIGDMSLYVAGGAKISGYVSVGIPALEKGGQYLEFEVGTTPENPRGSVPFPLISAANFEAAKARSSSLNGMFGFDTTNNVITWVQGDTIVKLGITEWGVMTKHGTSPWRYVEA